MKRGLLGFIFALGGLLLAQQPPPAERAQPAAPAAQPLPPGQLDNLVAPIALYPDNILSQILAASTYPLEVVEAEQWLQQNKNLSGQALLDAAHQQNWDPSVQALVVFPDVLARLNQDVRWTTDLGNAFLAQQGDVMAAVQRMRAKAEANGKLQSTPQDTVSTETQNGQSAITIQPANPQDVYVPYYDPAYVWGPPPDGYYPPLIYPPYDVGFTFWPPVPIGLYFGGFGIWGGLGWGWGPNWFGGGIFVNTNFFHRYGFAEYHGFGPGGAWVHDPYHRLGVPYANRAVANRFGGAAFRGGAASFRGGAPAFRGGGAQGFRGGAESASRGAERAAPAQRFGSPGFEQRNSGGNHSAFGGIQNGGATRMQSDHGFSSMHGGFGGGAPRGFGGGGARGGFSGGGARGGGARGGGRR